MNIEKQYDIIINEFSLTECILNGILNIEKKNFLHINNNNNDYDFVDCVQTNKILNINHNLNMILKEDYFFEKELKDLENKYWKSLMIQKGNII